MELFGRAWIETGALCAQSVKLSDPPDRPSDTQEGPGDRCDPSAKSPLGDNVKPKN
jgi:hypothetical protein